MTFADLPAGAAVFVDANTLTYYFEPHLVYGPACQPLMLSIEQQQILGFTSTHVLSEVAHRLMTMEAVAVFGWPFVGIAQRLRRHPAEVQRLTRFRQAIETILNSRIQVLNTTPSVVLAGAVISQQAGLLSNDALIVAVMQANGLTNLASSDTDFDRLSGLTRYAPG